MKNYKFETLSRKYTGTILDIYFQYCESRGREISEWAMDENIDDEKALKEFKDEMRYAEPNMKLTEI